MKLSGVMPPVATPFTDGEVAYDKLKNNLELWNRTGLSGYLVVGSNGEPVYLSDGEKLRVIEVAREAIPETKLLLAGTGLESTRETIRFTNEAGRIGADCALVVTPCYYKGSMSQTVLHDHFLAVAEASRIGILLYNVPQFTGVNLEPDTVARLSRHPNIYGIKDSSGNIAQLSQIIGQSEQGFAVFVGAAPVFYPALCVGAAGGILAVANVVPEVCVDIQRLYEDGRPAEARALQMRMTPLAQAVTVKHGIGGLKMAMDLAGYFGGNPRRPLKRPGAEAEKELKMLLQRLTAAADARPGASKETIAS